MSFLPTFQSTKDSTDPFGSFSVDDGGFPLSVIGASLSEGADHDGWLKSGAVTYTQDSPAAIDQSKIMQSITSSADQVTLTFGWNGPTGRVALNRLAATSVSAASEEVLWLLQDNGSLSTYSTTAKALTAQGDFPDAVAVVAVDASSAVMVNGDGTLVSTGPVDLSSVPTSASWGAVSFGGFAWLLDRSGVNGLMVRVGTEVESIATSPIPWTAPFVLDDKITFVSTDLTIKAVFDTSLAETMLTPPAFSSSVAFGHFGTVVAVGPAGELVSLDGTEWVTIGQGPTGVSQAFGTEDDPIVVAGGNLRRLVLGDEVTTEPFPQITDGETAAIGQGGLSGKLVTWFQGLEYGYYGYTRSVLRTLVSTDEWSGVIASAIVVAVLVGILVTLKLVGII